MARLQIFLPDDNIISRELAEETTRIGRAADNDLQIEHPSVSSHHAEITHQGGVFTLKDLDSTNGTSINDTEIKEQELQEGDRIQFGHVDALFGDELAGDSSLASPETGNMESAEIPAASGLSARPVDFVSSSPLPKVQSTKDPIRTAALALAVISILVSIAAIASAVLVIETPTFPVP
jgi:pSer/pThr/pTyr-binding forkhead associated (FHA) protein